MSILSSLAEVGRIFRDKAAAKIIEVHAPHAIADSSFVASPVQNENSYSVDIKYPHPATGAYEWGSGIHSTKGTPDKYPIEPKTKDYLAFLWPKVDGDPSFRRLPDGRVLLPHVEHPGVAPRPFLQPTIDETKEEFKRILGKGFKAEILQGVNKVEIIEIK